MKAQARKAVVARVTGIVQGVGFRYATVDEARRLRLTGWVRNTGDGAVEVLAEGGPEERGTGGLAPPGTARRLGP